MRIAFISACTTLVLLVAGACTYTPARVQWSREARELEQPPADFWLAVTVAAPPARDEDPLAAPADRPARYLMEADGVLRVALGPGADEKVFPGQLRRLEADQVAALWNRLRTSGLLDAEHPDLEGAAPTDPGAYAGRTVFVVEYSALGVRRRLAIDSIGSPSSGPTRMLVEDMAALAWIAPPPNRTTAVETPTDG